MFNIFLKCFAYILLIVKFNFNNVQSCHVDWVEANTSCLH